MNELENQALAMLLDGDDPVLAALRLQSPSLERSTRELTGVGFFTRLRLAENAIPLQGQPSFAIADVVAEIDGLRHGAGFVLFVRGGRLELLEGYTFDEPWPSMISQYQLEYVRGPIRDITSLQDVPGWPALA